SRPARAGRRDRHGSRAELAFAPAVGGERQGHGSVRLEAHQHRRPEPALTDLEAGAAKRATERVEEALSLLRRRGSREFGPAPTADVPVKRELRHRQDHSAHVREPPLHPACLLEDAQAGDLRGEPLAVLGAVVRADPEEHEDTGFYFGYALVPDVDAG